MKKFLSLLLSFSLLFGMGTSVFADVESEIDRNDPDVIKALDLIDKTNAKIEDEINKGVIAADKLLTDYLLQLKKHEEAQVMAGLIEQKHGLLVTLDSPGLDETEIEEIKDLLYQIELKLINEQRNIDNELQLVEQELAEITSILVQEDGNYISLSQTQIQNKVKGKSTLSKYEKLTVNYIEQLDKIITNVYEKTSKMSQQTIEKVAKVGIKAECSWVLVRFADRCEWIDPIHVVGDN